MTRIFLSALLIVSLFVLAGCSNDNAAATPDTTPNNGVVNDNATNNNDLGNRESSVGDDMREMVDNAGDAMKDMATDGAINDANHNNQ